jgi:hypothetical protein
MQGNWTAMTAMSPQSRNVTIPSKVEMSPGGDSKSSHSLLSGKLVFRLRRVLPRQRAGFARAGGKP